MGTLHRNALPAFSESRLCSGARHLCVLGSFTAAVQDGIGQGQGAVCRHMGHGSASSRTGLLPSSPLRTVHESFLSHSSTPSNASFGETRFRDRNSLAMNPVMALWMK